jgi:iron complex outermembrane receptor protein
MKLRTYQLSQHLGSAIGHRCLLATLAAFLAIGLYAQESEREEEETDEELLELAPFTVTGESVKGYVQTTTLSATRANTPIIDLPHSVQIVTKEQMDDMGLDHLGQAARYVSNTDTRDSSNDRIRIRGFGTATAYVDGISAGSTSLNWDRQQAFVERVEVVKGASAVLYGAAPPGGLVNNVTVKPLTYARHQVRGGGGTKGYYKFEADSTGPLNENDSLRYRVTGVVFKTESQAHPHFSPAKRWAIFPQLYVRPFEKTEVLLQYTWDKLDGHQGTTVRPYWNTQTNSTWDLPWEWYRGELDDSSVTERKWYSATWIQTFNDNWHFKANAMYADMYGVQEWGYTRGVPGDPLTLLRNFRHLERPYRVLNGQFDLVGNMDFGAMQHKVLLGGQLRREEQSNRYTDRYYPAFPTLTPTYGNPRYAGEADHAFLLDEGRSGIGNSYVSTSEFCGVGDLCANGWAQTGEIMSDVRDRTEEKITNAFYWNDIMTFWDNRIHVTVGGRWDYFNHTTTDWGRPDNHPKGGKDTRITDEDTLEYFPRYAFLYKVTPGFSAYFLYSESMIPVLGFEPTTGQKFLPEIGEQIEGGVKWSLFDGRFSGSASYFEIVRTNIKETDHVRFITVQQKEATATGFEIDTHFQITDSFQILAGYGSLEQEITASVADLYFGTDERVTSSPVGDVITNIPDASGYFWAKYSVLDGSLKGVSAAFGGSHLGERFIVSDKSRALPSYMVWDAMFQYQFQGKLEGVTAQFNVSNLEDEIYWVSGTGTFGKPANRRLIRFHLSYTW